MARRPSSVDRLTRTGIADILSTLEELRASGAEVVSVGDGFDLNGPYAEVIVAVMALAAKMERLAIAERIAAACERDTAPKPSRAFSSRRT